jgi:hypothetical protein
MIEERGKGRKGRRERDREIKTTTNNERGEEREQQTNRTE